MPPLKIRSLATLPIAVAIGLLASLLLQQLRPLGIDVSGNRVAIKLLADTTLPGEGAVDAPVKIVVFSDYQCPVCRTTEPGLLRAVRAEGGARVEYRDWPIFGEMSEFAARVALAARAEGLYVPVRRALMTEPRRLDSQVIRQAAERAGADWGRIVREMERGRAGIDAALHAARLEALAFNLPGTPAYLVGSRLVIGAQSESQFRRLIRKARADAV